MDKELAQALKQNYELRLEELEIKEGELETLLDEFEREEYEIRGKIRDIERSICEHSFAVDSWRLEEDRIDVTQTCRKCDVSFKKSFEIESGMHLLGLDTKPERNRTYFLNARRSPLFVEDGTRHLEALGIIIKEVYLPCARKLLNINEVI